MGKKGQIFLTGGFLVIHEEGMREVKKKITSRLTSTGKIH